MNKIINRPLRRKIRLFFSCNGRHLLLMVTLWIPFLIPTPQTILNYVPQKTSVK